MRLLLLTAFVLTPIYSMGSNMCNICLYTPEPTSEMRHGKGGNTVAQGEQDHVEKLSAPLYTGDLFFSFDNQDRLPLPSKKGVFLSVQGKKYHTIKILSSTGKSWAKIPFNCSEYEYGSKIKFESSGFYSAGWKTYPLPKDVTKCPWHPEHKEK